VEGRKVLVVEDERDINELVSYNLGKAGFRVESAFDGAEALRKAHREKFDLIILDIMLPGMDGFELCRAVKSDRELSGIPIIMLTARSEEVDRVLGLELGADDYVVKPFSPRELVARAKAVLRRVARREEAGEAAGGKVFATGDIEIDAEKFVVRKRGSPVALSATEFKLLLYFASRPGRVFSRDFLLDAVWGDESYVEPRTVDVHIRRLREKIEDDPSNPKRLLTRRGIGYYFSGEGRSG
jgi:DNA-binding response OmpR family regulator